MEVIFNTQHDGLIVRNAFDFVAPFPGNLDACLHGFRAGIHRENGVVSKVLRDKLREFGEYIIVEGPGAERKRGRLLGQSLDQLRVTVALVDGGIGREEVQVMAALGIPDRGA